MTATSFDLVVPGDVRFGSGRLRELPATLVAMDVAHVLLVTGRTAERADPARRALTGAGISSAVLRVAGEPSVDSVREGTAVALESGCHAVVGLGGGSALDVAKAVALLAGTGTDPLDHLEVVGRGLPVRHPGLPCIAVPTTAGTGAEVTRNAVLSAQGVKASLRSPFLVARAAIVDPDLLSGLRPHTIAAGGMDALTQLVEPFLSVRATPVTDALAVEGLRRSARSLLPAYEHGLAGDAAYARRDDLALASLLGGLCLANAGLGVVHGIAGVVGGRHDAPHGAVCAALLAPALETNVQALRRRAPDHPSTAKLDELATLLTGRADATPADAVRWLARLCAALAIPGLGQYGVTGDDLPHLVAAVRRASSTRANPVELTDEEITAIITAAL